MEVNSAQLVSEMVTLSQRLEAIKVQRAALDRNAEAIKDRMVQIVDVLTPDVYTIGRLSQLIGRSRTWLSTMTTAHRSK